MSPMMGNPNPNPNLTPEKEKSLEELLGPILLGERVIKLAQEAESSKVDCTELARKVQVVCDNLRSVVRVVSGTQCVNERPIRRIVGEVSKNLERTLAFVRKCKKHGAVLRQVFSMTTTADFRKVWNLLESSNGDMVWLLSILDSKDGSNVSLPPIASNDPILAWVWTFIYTLQLGQPKDRAEAATELGSLAKDNDRTKFIILEEGGVPPLLKLLKEASSPDAQVAAANALVNVTTNQDRVVSYVVESHAAPTIVQVLGDSPMRVRVSVANLVSAMAEQHELAREELVRANVTRPLVSLLSMDTVLADPMAGRASIHSLVLNLSNVGETNSDGSSRGSSHHRREREREREVESLELRKEVKISCAKALWKLSKGCFSSCKKITETKGLLCLAKIIESESGELQLNCLMAVMEIAAVAESNADLRRAAFKRTAPAAKAVIDQLLRVVQEESNPALVIPAIKAIGSLARNFSGKVPQVLGPLVAQLGNRDVDVASEAAIALGKFVSPDNYNCVDHSKAILELEGVPKLMSLLQINDRQQVHGLRLLCYLALNVGNSKVLEQERALNTLERFSRPVQTQYPDLKDLFANAIHHLTLYQPGAQLHRQPLGL